ncbi:MAG: acetylxylan esterase [Firmicutes bacterium]|nr:acetylxylan esterase [Bacillota bacterium]
MKLYTPQNLYTDYLTGTNEPEAVIVKEYIKGTNKYYNIFFNGERTEFGVPRVYATFSHPLNTQESVPLVVFCHDYAKSHKNEEALTFFNSLGYASIAVDYSGTDETGGRGTIYPSEINFAKEDGNRWSAKEGADAKQTPYYIWSTITMQAIKVATTMFSSIINSTKIAIVGIGAGTYQTYHLAAVDKRICGAVSIDGCGWSEFANIFKFKEYDAGQGEFPFDQARLSAGVSRQSYAQFIDVPFLIASGTMSRDCNMDRAYDTADRINQRRESRIALTPHSKNILGYRQFNTLKLWLEQCFTDQRFDEEPEIALSVNESGELLANLFTDQPNKIDYIRLYYSFDSYDPLTRFFDCVEMIKIDNVSGEFKATFSGKITPYSESKKIFTFANVTYKSGFTFSTNLIVRNLKDFGTLNRRVNDALIISSKNQFFDVSVLTRAAREAFPKKEALTLVTGEIDGIAAISSKANFIATLKVGQVKKKQDTILGLNIFTKEAQELKVCVYVPTQVGQVAGCALEGYEAYYNTKKGVWQKIVLSPTHFKKKNQDNTKGQYLKTFEEITLIEFFVENQNEEAFAISSLIAL